MTPFAADAPAETPNAFQWTRQTPKIVPFHGQNLDFIKYMFHWAHASQPPNSHFRTATYVPNTNKHTDHVAYNICRNRPQLCNACDPAWKLDDHYV